MAYSNWDAKVFRNSKRMMNREDVAVYDEEEAIFPKWGRIWANLMKNKERSDNRWWKHSHHAVLGDKEVRLCAYKNFPELWVWKKNCSEPETVLIIGDSERDEYYEKSYLEKEGSIEVNNKIWKWYFVMEENSITILLIEPDGTKWKGVSGYAY